MLINPIKWSVHLKVHKIKDRTTHYLYKIWDDNVHQIVQGNYEHQVNSQQTSILTPELIDEQLKHLSIKNQRPSATIQSTTINQSITLSRYIPTTSSTDNNSSFCTTMTKVLSIL